MAYGPQWKSLQVANPNVGGLLSTAQSGINNAGEVGRDVLTAYDEGQKMKNDALVAQELADISTPEQMEAWLKQGGLNGRNVSGASLEAMLSHRQAIAREAAAALAAGGSAPSGGSRSTGSNPRRSGASSSSAPAAESGVSTDALLALALGQNPPATPVAGAPEPSVDRLQTRPTTEVTPAPLNGPAPFVSGATSTEFDIPDLTSLSDDDLAAEIAALGG